MSKGTDIAQRRALARANGYVEYLDKRTELINAAARVFRRKGFSAAKLQDIADEVGYDRASIYYYTTGKEELYRDVVAEAVLSNILMAEKLQAEDERADRKLIRFIDELMTSYKNNYPYLYVYVQEDMTLMRERGSWAQDMRALERRFDSALQKIIKQGLDEGSLQSPIKDPWIIANGILGMCTWSHRWYQPEGKRSMEDISRAFSEMIVNGLSAGVPDLEPVPVPVPARPPRRPKSPARRPSRKV